jgi:hypothetical protein
MSPQDLVFQLSIKMNTKLVIELNMPQETSIEPNTTSIVFATAKV